MHTVIGQRLKSSRGRLIAAGVVGVLTVAADFALVRSGYSEGTGALAVVVLAAYVWLCDGDLDSLGLRLTPRQGCWWWVRASLWIGLAVLVCIVVGIQLWMMTGRDVPVYITRPRGIGYVFLRMCVFAPVIEEVIFRLGLCVPFAVWLGPRKTIVVSGIVFAMLHVIGGNASPENLVGGFFLAWAYLKSDSIVVPVALHSLGNLFALAAQVGAWYWLGNAA
ncbi:MAG: CPBP family intramembrane glutamic endopeptidase [Planctomycetaceae bacterium]